MSLKETLFFPQVHLRGGTVVPMQKPGNTTLESRKKDYSLLVALDASGEASGDVFLDDGLSVDIKRLITCMKCYTEALVYRTLTTPSVAYYE